MYFGEPGAQEAAHELLGEPVGLEFCVLSSFILTSGIPFREVPPQT